MELDVICRLSMMVGFLSAGFLAMLIGAVVVALHCWYKSTWKDLEDMMDDLEKRREAHQNENNDT